MDDPASAEATELGAALRRRKLSPVELVDEILARIDALNPQLNAYLAVFAQQARDTAHRAERKLRSRSAAGALLGIPLSIKDLVLTTEGPTTAGTRAFGAGIQGTHDAPVIRRLRRAGAIILGKTNLHEVALGVTSANEHFGPVRNPWDTTRVAGGSSGGSAVAVSAGLGPLSVGSDTRGSIRIPAACCGITGLKPTYGLVSTVDVVPLSPMLDHVGPMARSAADCALLLGAMLGRPVAAAPMRRGWRVGISEYHLRNLDSSVEAAIEGAIRELEKMGCRLRRVTMPGLEGVQEASAVISSAEAVTYHDATLKSNPTGYGPLVRQRLEGGYRRTAVDFLRAVATRDAVRAAFRATFDDVDCLVGACLPVPAVGIGELSVQINGVEETVVDAYTRYNAPQNMAGVPALALPGGFTSQGLPVGWQLIASWGREDVLFALGAAYQRRTDFHQRCPPIGKRAGLHLPAAAPLRSTPVKKVTRGVGART